MTDNGDSGTPGHADRDASISFSGAFVVLPTAGKASHHHRSMPCETGAAPAERTVLLVDDEKIIRTTTSRILQRLGYDVITAADGIEAVETYREHVDTVSCVVLDLTMPRMGGEEALHELRKIRCDVPVIMTSGYNKDEVTQMFIGHGLAGFLQKPYKITELGQTLQRAIGQAP